MPQAHMEKTRQQIESELLINVERACVAFIKHPSDSNRKAYVEALRVFNGLVVYGKAPDRL